MRVTVDFLPLRRVLNVGVFESTGCRASLLLARHRRIWDLTVAGTTHLDFVEIAYTVPLLKTLGLAGPIDAHRTIDIVNSLHLDFFDAKLTRRVTSGGATERFPEVSVRRHEFPAVQL